MLQLLDGDGDGYAVRVQAADLSIGGGFFEPATVCYRQSYTTQCFGGDGSSMDDLALTMSGQSYLKRIEMGYFNACGVKDWNTSELVCWGDETHPVYTDNPQTNDVVEFDLSKINACQISTNGKIECWGADDSAGMISGIPSAGPYSGLSLGAYHGCALDTSSAPVCWGSDVDGQVSLAPSTQGFTKLAGGRYHHCGLLDTGAIECWGAAVQYSDLVTQTPTGTDFVDIAAGTSGTCALNSAGELTCWGFTASLTNDVPGGEGYSTVVVHDDGACVLDESRNVVCWGSDQGANIAVLDATPILSDCGYIRSPKLVVPGDCDDTDSSIAPISTYYRDNDQDGSGRTATFQSVAVGLSNACGVVDSGQIECWGSDSQSVLSEKPGGSSWVEVAAVSGGYCAMHSNGAAFCWGANWTNGGWAQPSVTTASGMWSDEGLVCFIDVDGGIECLGYDSYGRGLGASDGP